MYIQYSTQLRAMFANERLAKMLDVQQRQTGPLFRPRAQEKILESKLHEEKEFRYVRVIANIFE
jgi:hypothetical protein